MKTLFGKSALRSQRRPYWLLLVLALFFAGQVASSAHWHAADSVNQLDADCALCMLSGANGAAAITTVWQSLSIPLGSIFFVYFVATMRRSAPRFFDSRAPPQYA